MTRLGTVMSSFEGDKIKKLLGSLITCANFNFKIDTWDNNLHDSHLLTARGHSQSGYNFGSCMVIEASWETSRSWTPHNVMWAIDVTLMFTCHAILWLHWIGILGLLSSPSCSHALDMEQMMQGILLKYWHYSWIRTGNVWLSWIGNDCTYTQSSSWGWSTEESDFILVESITKRRTFGHPYTQYKMMKWVATFEAIGWSCPRKLVIDVHANAIGLTTGMRCGAEL